MRLPLSAVRASLMALALAACSRPPPPPSSTAAAAPTREALSLTYLGVAGWALDDGPHTLLIDPYVSRRDPKSDADALIPDEAAIARYVPHCADLILVGHSHYDHLLDVPTVARRTHATVVGTESTANVMRGAGIPDASLVVVHPGDEVERGPFAVRALHSLHSLTGQPDIPIPAGVPLPMKAGEYGEGGTLAYVVHVSGRALLFLDTANFVEKELTGFRPDVAVIAVGLRQKIPDYSCRLMRALGQPPVVLPNHFDAHREPIGAEHEGPKEAADLADFAREIHACAPATTVIMPVRFQAIPL